MRKHAERFSRGYSGAWCRVRARLNANFPTVSILHPTGPQGRNSIFQRWPPPIPRWASRPRATPLWKTIARARTCYRIRRYIRHRNTLCPRKFPNVRRRIERRREEGGDLCFSQSSITTPGEYTFPYVCARIHTRAYVKPRLKFRLLDPR